MKSKMGDTNLVVSSIIYALREVERGRSLNTQKSYDEYFMNVVCDMEREEVKENQEGSVRSSGVYSGI